MFGRSRTSLADEHLLGEYEAAKSGIPQDGMGALVKSKWTDGIHDNLEVSKWTKMK